MSTATMRQSENAPLPVADYAHAVEVPLGNGNSMIYLCGMGPREKSTNKVPGIVWSEDGEIESYDFEAQSRNVFQNIETVLKDLGGRGLRDVVDVQVFLVNIARDFPAFNKLWREYMVSDDGWMPTRTTVQVAALPLKEIFVELKCVAVLAGTGS
jgi:enamine deaminase RidA (YjgF/YER057c/UK114 family)